MDDQVYSTRGAFPSVEQASEPILRVVHYPIAVVPPLYQCELLAWKVGIVVCRVHSTFWHYKSWLAGIKLLAQFWLIVSLPWKECCVLSNRILLSDPDIKRFGNSLCCSGEGLWDLPDCIRRYPTSGTGVFV